MKLFSSCHAATEDCHRTHTFAVAHLYADDVPMKMHIHDTYEIYYSISGGKQFLIDDRFYDFVPGDMFFINQYESHYISQLGEQAHERIVLSIDPQYLKHCSTELTDLNRCFTDHSLPGGHRIHLTRSQQEKFMWYIHRFEDNTGYGSDVMDRAVFMELMLYLNLLFFDKSRQEELPAPSESHHAQVDAILSYINANIRSDLSIGTLAAHFYMSSSNICRIFKETTGTTLNRYITAKRITLAKSLLAQGKSVTEACMESGFGDYSNFLKAFTRAVGVSPGKYAAYARS